MRADSSSQSICEEECNFRHLTYLHEKESNRLILKNFYKKLRAAQLVFGQTKLVKDMPS